MRNIFLILLVFSSIVMAKEVTVSILPQKYFVEKIAKDKIKVNVMVKPGASPATYEPKTSQMKLLSKSDAYFAIDVPFEKVWLDKFKTANKNMIVVDTDEGIEKQEIQAHHHEETNHNEEKKVDHDHEEEGHNHEGLDPHIWLDPVLVKIQAKNIYDTLVEIDSVNKEFYTKNYKDFLNELEKLDQILNEILKNDQNKAFMVFHPSWGYFAKRYNLKQIAIEIEGKEPKPAQLVELIDEAKENNIKIVFVAPQFSKKGASTISKSIDATVTAIDPLSEDWSNNLIKVAKEIANSYK
jgi:zinc transport system substrate-binding protein